MRVRGLHVKDDVLCQLCLARVMIGQRVPDEDVQHVVVPFDIFLDKDVGHDGINRVWCFHHLMMVPMKMMKETREPCLEAYQRLMMNTDIVNARHLKIVSDKLPERVDLHLEQKIQLIWIRTPFDRDVKDQRVDIDAL